MRTQVRCKQNELISAMCARLSCLSGGGEKDVAYGWHRGIRGTGLVPAIPTKFCPRKIGR